MSEIIVLDSGPLWLACLAPGKPEADRCRDWLAHFLRFPEVVARVWDAIA